MHTRTPTSLSIYDDPLGMLGRDHSKLVIELETYLIIHGIIVWRIAWKVEETHANGRQITIMKGHPTNHIHIPELEEEKEIAASGAWKIGYSHNSKATPEHTILMKRPSSI